MEPQGVERRLAAILAADVAGYSRLMDADEEATLRTLKAYREVIDGLVASHRGRVFGAAGDSVIAEFASPVEAVRCAVDIQRSVETSNADLPEDRRMRFRIGVNLGDVMVEGDDLLGDGVNVAARLEGSADAGGICISGGAYDQVRKALDLGYEFLGKHKVKNIAEPVPVYRVHTDPGAVPRITGAQRRQWQRA
ncbi:MAG: adenylate/guanylate cyclase domain-containing protein, partial [Alphaproteobacteria bacterium]